MRRYVLSDRPKNRHVSEICIFIQDKEQPIWIFAAIEVWSRLSPSFEISPVDRICNGFL